MEHRQLRAFVTVAERLSFTRAGDELGIAQSAVSQAVRRLEATSGVILFDRSSHHVTLTGDGRTLLPHARAALTALDHVDAVLAQLPQGRRDVLRIATTSGIGPRLAPVLGRFAAARPDVSLELPAWSTREKLEALRMGRVDLAFFRSAPPDEPGLHHRVAWQERYVALVPADHAAASTDPVEVRHIATLPMLRIGRADDPMMTAQLREVCRAIGLPPRPGPRVGTFQDTLAMVAAGGVWTLHVEGNLPPGALGVAARRLPPAAPLSTVWIGWRDAGPETPVARFLAELGASG